MSKGRHKRPISKKTTLLLEQLRRKTGVRSAEKRFLIVCEDNKSAPSYLNALLRHLKLSGSDVVVVGSSGNTQPIQVVARAIDLRREAQRPSSGTLPFDEVWCVIDGDYGERIANARHSAVANDIRLAISTPCFEYWILLHFEESSAPAANCDDVVDTLKSRHLRDYAKGSFEFRALTVHAAHACERAMRLRMLRSDLVPNAEDHNPSSEMYLLVNALRGNADNTEKTVDNSCRHFGKP
jgi:hypothetical protein